MSSQTNWRTHLEVAGRRLQSAAEQLEEDRANMGEVFWLRDALDQIRRCAERLEQRAATGGC